MEIIRFMQGKSKNKRVDILLYQGDDGNHFYNIKTKTLVDFKTRNIIETNLAFSVETFQYLSEMFGVFTTDPELKNKILNVELGKMNKINVNTNLIIQ